MKYAILAASLLLPACAETAVSPPAQPVQAELSRDAAVAAARQDAATRFQMTALPGVIANREGRYWVIDFRAPDGSGVHYAIASDGTIRERRVVQ